MQEILDCVSRSDLEHNNNNLQMDGHHFLYKNGGRPFVNSYVWHLGQMELVLWI
jgi:hypothetical protein